MNLGRDSRGRSAIDLLLGMALAACQWLAVPVALIEWVMLQRWPALRRWLSQCPHGTLRALRQVVFARLARQVFKIAMLVGFEAAVLRRVRCRGTHRLPRQGCVIALVHSHWGRVLARWVNSQRFARVFAHERWSRWTGDAHIAASVGGLHRAVNLLAQGQRVAVVADELPPQTGCNVVFLGVHKRATIRATWLAARAGVPVVPVTVGYAAGAIRVRIGPPMEPGRRRSECVETTRALLRTFERRIRRRPDEWQDLFVFFRTAQRDPPAWLR